MALLAAGAVLLFTGCRRLDVIGTASVVSLAGVLDRLPAEKRQGYWSLEAPDGEARFLLNADFTGEYDALLEVDLAPFVEAGQDVSCMPEGTVREDTIVVGAKLEIDPAGIDMALDAYRHLLRISPGAVGNHMAMDHFGVDLNGGNLFEWARDMDENDKDIVFELDPGIFRDGRWTLWRPWMRRAPP